MHVINDPVPDLTHVIRPHSEVIEMASDVFAVISKLFVTGSNVFAVISKVFALTSNVFAAISKVFAATSKVFAIGSEVFAATCIVFATTEMTLPDEAMTSLIGAIGTYYRAIPLREARTHVIFHATMPMSSILRLVAFAHKSLLANTDLELDAIASMPSSVQAFLFRTSRLKYSC